MFRSVFSVLISFLITSASCAQALIESNLPIIVINTNGAVIQDEPKVSADMGIIDNASGINHVNDPFNGYHGKIAIEIRGSSSQMFPKKQYGFELKDDSGNDVNASLLGLPPEEDWILFAPYNDKSLMRDALAYNLGRSMGRYASRSRFCEVILNGQYDGVYVLLEKIKRDANRVDISELNVDENTGDDLTGGYILKIDKTTGNGDLGWSSTFTPRHANGSQAVWYFYEYPAMEDISFQQQQYIKDFMRNFESALNGSKFRDPSTGYAKYIDVESFIDFLIMNEITRNVDGYRISTFLHKQKDSKGGKLVMGPIWDFNLGFGNADYCQGFDKTGFAYEFNEICSGDWWLVPFWWERLMEDPAFKRKLSRRWVELRESAFSDEEIMGKIDSLTNVLSAGAANRNFQRWPVLGTYVWPNFFIGNTFTQEVDWLKTWIVDRLEWLDAEWFSDATAVVSESDQFVLQGPNPFDSKLTLQISSPFFPVSISLYNSTGQLVFQKSLTGLADGNVEISTEGLGSGCYYLKVVSRVEGVVTFKLLKTTNATP